MKTQRLNHRTSRGGVMALALLTGLASAGTAVAQSTTAPASQPATQPVVPVLARINGIVIDRDSFTNLLMEINGIRVFDQIFSLQVVRQACEQDGLKITQKEVIAERDRLLARALEDANPNVKFASLSEQEKDSLTLQFLQQRNVPLAEFGIRLQTDACLRALSAGKIVVTPEQIKQQYAIEFGERAQVVDIVVRETSDASAIYNAVEKDGKTVDQALQQLQESLKDKPDRMPQVRGNIMVSKSDTRLSPVFLKAIFDTREGHVSPGIPDPNPNQPGLHVIFVQKQIPADTLTTFDSVKDKIRLRLEDAAEREWATKQLQSLRQSARVTVEDPVLGALYSQIKAQQESNRRAQEAAASQTNAAATQPAGAPNAAPANK